MGNLYKENQMNRNEGIDPSGLTPLRKLSRREFVGKLSAAAGGAGLLTAAFTGCALTPSQKAEATEAVLDTIGKVPKVKLNKRLVRRRAASGSNLG